ncbi:peptidoglycan-N-acetylglucosamine deacetylase [Entomortierella parvispora]|uniref:Peptidoglycan-N-acetylglucosamine deacetylase n=1 Tax=Entomortierella parvispora TaxID=205924 RepID=A0A9P3H172_9FUNG|nr:peptidoglycan-N-acetylglucosamine deacetylase [Entomortierella parvispora]
MKTSATFSRKKFLFTTTAAVILCCSFATVSTVEAGLNIADFPPSSEVPPTNSPQVQKWLSEIDLTGAPSIEANSGDPPNCPSKVAEGVCYWTCEDCAADDIITCPDKNVWGLTFDDGPTPATPDLLQFLDQQKVKATFFLIGANVVQHPDVVLQEVKAGHHLASHTWSHHALTTLTNEQIVAEIKWTEKAIEDATGYRVRYMRPPYGDVDNRVRFVLKKLGYTVVDWTGDTFDSNDWKIPQVSVDSTRTKYENAIKKYAGPTANNTQGFITLEHDLTSDTVSVAKTAIPLGLSLKLNIMTVAECLHDSSPYAAVNGTLAALPTLTNATFPVANASAVPSPTSASSPPSDSSSSITSDGNSIRNSGPLKAHNAAGVSLRSVRGQHFLGRFFPSGQSNPSSRSSRSWFAVSSSAASSVSAADIHSAVALVQKSSTQAIQKALWSGLVLGSFVAGLVSL